MKLLRVVFSTTCKMAMRIRIIVLLLLGANWACDARELSNLHMSDTLISYNGQEVAGNEKVCTLCEEFTSQALDYLSENKTQTEILEILHNSCSQLHSFKQQCITLVDYYAPLFFLEASSIQPEDFCRKVDLCEQISKISSHFHEDSCGICHQAVAEVIAKLRDPDMQLELIEMLLHACKSMEKYAQKCKMMVFKYGPLILANAEQFLETTDICTALHACNSTKSFMKEVPLSSAEVSILSDA